MRILTILILCVCCMGTMYYPDPEVATDGLIGYYTSSGTTVRDCTADDGTHQQFTTTTAGTVSRIGVVFGNTTTSNHFECAIYDSAKTTRLAYTNSTAIQSDYGWNYADLVSDYTLVAATSYWLIATVNDDSDFKSRGTTSGSNSVYYDGTWSASDSSINDSTLIDSSAEFAIFADNGQVTP